MHKVFWAAMAALALTAAAPIPPDKLAAFLDRTIDAEMAKDHIAGATVSVVQGGKVIALRGYGIAGVNPKRAVDPSRTLFGIASTSKIFTWTTLLQATEAGRVDLDKPVNDYLPADLRIPAQGFSKPIRFVDLLRHTTGYEDHDVMVLSPSVYGGHQPSIAEYLRHARPEREREPGLEPSYSNYAPNLAAFVALRGSGAPDFDTLVERDIFKPLGMTSTTFREPKDGPSHLPAPMPADLLARRTQNLMWNGSGFTVHPYEHMMDGPASAASTTAADMARFMLAQLNGGALEGTRIYGAKTAQAFRTPLLGGAQTNRWAHGLMMVALPGGHTGYGHDGGTSTTTASLFVVPDLDLGVFTASNSGGGGQLVWNLADKIVREFYAKDAPGPDHPRPGSPALVRDAATYEGTYLSVRRPYSGLAKLVLYEPQAVTVDTAGYLHAASGGRDRRWVPAGRPGAFVDAEGEEVLAFEFGPDGRAVSWRDPLATRTMERVSPLVAMPIMIGLVAASGLATLAILGAGLWRLIRRKRLAQRPPGLRRFDRAQAATALALLLAIACVAVSAATADMAGGASFPPPPLRGFALFACLTGLGVLVQIARAPGLWRSGTPGWKRLLRLAAIVPVALLVVRIGVAGGLEFWS